MKQFKMITFDAYSALLKLEDSMVPIVERVINREEVDSLAFFRMWRTRQWDYVLLGSNLEKGYHSYEYLTRATLLYTMKKFNVTLTQEEQDEMVDGWSHMKAWPEAKEVLDEIQRRGYKIAILSNGDEKMLRPLIESTGIQFDEVFGAEHAKAYKPNPAIYALPFELCGYKNEEVLHVAGSTFDLMGAKSAGIFCAWSNRYDDFPIDEKYTPDYNFKDLRGLLEIL